MNSKIVSLVAFCIMSGSLAGAQHSWVEDANVIPNPSSAELNYSTVNNGDTNSAVYDGLKKLAKNGDWHVYYSEVGSGSVSLHPNYPGTKTEDPSKILLFSGRDDYGSVWTQSYTSFVLNDQALNSDSIRISFDVEYLGKNGDPDLNISVLPWEVIEEDVDLRMGTPNATYRTKFMFGLVNLETGEFYDANVSSQGTPLKFNYEENNWLYKTDEFGKLTVSFELVSDQLETITASGLGLVIETSAGSYENYAEYYSIGNFKVETATVPEPAAYAVSFGIFALCFAALRRKK